MKKVKKGSIQLLKAQPEVENSAMPIPSIIPEGDNIRVYSMAVHEGHSASSRYCLFGRPLPPVEHRVKPYLVPELSYESPLEEMHWMAFAAYNQTK